MSMKALPDPLIFRGETQVEWKGRILDYFAGCDYLRLARNPLVIQAAIDGAREFGLGVSASRRTTGNHPLYLALESDLARFFGSPALLTATGYNTNSVVAQSMVGRFTHALLDARAHPSVREAAHLLGAEVLTFEHRSASSLRSIQASLPARAQILLLTDGLFAHDGSVAPLDDYRCVLRRTSWMLVDDCHAAGVLGNRGRGTIELLGVRRERVIQTITLSKAFGSQGGGVLAERRVLEAIVERSPAFAGGTPPALPMVAAARASIALLQQDASRRHRLLRNSNSVKEALQAAGVLQTVTPGPVFCLLPDTRSSKRIHRRLLSHGILPPWIRYPGGPKQGYFRFALSSEHTPAQLENLIRALTP